MIGRAAAPTIGFDLDMTLIDSRPGIKAVYDLLAAETGTFIDSEQAVNRLGPPVEQELVRWFAAGDVRAAADRYRALYADHGIAGCLVLPGAEDALAAVRKHGGRTLVVTGKFTPNARRNLDALGLVVDGLFGSVFGSEKGVVLREEGASVYVGDHLADILGARTAGALAVGVATGAHDAQELGDAGADVVLPTLTAFPEWLDSHLSARGR